MLICAIAVRAEPPVGHRPSNAYLPPSSHSHSYQTHHHGGGGLLSAGVGGGYRAINGGFQENEGQHVDAQLLRKIEEILLIQENQGHSSSGNYFSLFY